MQKQESIILPMRTVQESNMESAPDALKSILQRQEAIDKGECDLNSYSYAVMK